MQDSCLEDDITAQENKTTTSMQLVSNVLRTESIINQAKLQYCTLAQDISLVHFGTEQTLVVLLSQVISPKPLDDIMPYMHGWLLQQPIASVFQS